jgi:DNA invertase Pin-like site-specific DNA recombinase
MADIPAVIYAAKSSPDPKDSVASQVTATRARLDALGGRRLVAKPFSEENVSGYRRSRGPKLEAAMATAKAVAAEQGQAELWVFHSTRLARGSGRKREARALGEVFYDLRRHGVALRSVEDDPYVTDEAFIGMASKMANKYSDDLSAHVRRGKAGQFERGERLGGPVPDGYQLIRSLADGTTVSEYVYDDERAPIIRRVRDLALDGYAPASIARKLNAEGHRTKSGKAWTRRRVQDMLSNPFYVGRAVINRGKPDQRTRPGKWPALIAPDDFDRIQLMTAKRDKAAKNHVARTGRRTTRYVLARLGRCDRCGERMYCVTSPYKRKDGTQQRCYVCANVKSVTGLCDQPRIDAAQADASVVKHLGQLFIDFDAWLASLAQSTEQHRATLETQLANALDELRRRDHLESKLRARYLEAVANDEPNQRAVEDSLNHVIHDKTSQQTTVRDLQTQLAAEPADPSVDAMLDVYNQLAAAVRSNDKDSVADLNERLRTVFKEVRIDTVDESTVGLLPVLRDDVLDRYENLIPVMADETGATPSLAVPPTSPAVLWTPNATR